MSNPSTKPERVSTRTLPPGDWRGVVSPAHHALCFLRAFHHNFGMPPSKLRSDLMIFLPQINDVRRIATEQQVALYLVGGPVRDLLLGRACTDVDIVLIGSAIEFANIVVAQLGGVLVTHPQFGNATWQKNGIAVDFITARREFYASPAALPTVEPSDLEADLKRRDFTINTLAIRLDGDRWGELVDLCGGMLDLEAGIVRFLHPLSFQDDPTRIFRAVRYEQRLSFVLSDETEIAVQAHKQFVQRLSGVRIWHELVLILHESTRCAILERLDELNVLQEIVPPLCWDKAWCAVSMRLEVVLKRGRWVVDDNAVPYFLVWIGGGFSAETQQALAHRLQLPNQLTKQLLAVRPLLVALDELDEQRPSAIEKILRPYRNAPDLLLALCALRPQSAETITHYWFEWRHVRAHLNGNDLRRLGLTPGPHFREILDTLLAQRLDGLITTRAEAEAFVRRNFAA